MKKNLQNIKNTIFNETQIPKIYINLNKEINTINNNLWQIFSKKQYSLYDDYQNQFHLTEKKIEHYAKITGPAEIKRLTKQKLVSLQKTRLEMLTQSIWFADKCKKKKQRIRKSNYKLQQIENQINLLQQQIDFYKKNNQKLQNDLALKNNQFKDKTNIDFFNTNPQIEIKNNLNQLMNSYISPYSPKILKRCQSNPSDQTLIKTIHINKKLREILDETQIQKRYLQYIFRECKKKAQRIERKKKAKVKSLIFFLQNQEIKKFIYNLMYQK